MNTKHRLDERGQGLTEYLILMMLIAVVCIGASQTLGTTVKKKLQVVRDHIHKDVSPGQ